MSYKPKYILVDGSSYLYRAFHAMPPLVSSSGQPTGAVRGVISMLRKIMSDYPESNVVVVFDAKGKTFRHEQYPEYKANRPPMPQELREQIAPIHKIIQAMGLPLLVESGVEADDVIGTLAHQACLANELVLISTGDKDMAQLVNAHVTLINTMTDELLDRKKVVEKFGVPPELIIDYLALMGDKVDNIPGVEKCGPKTAVKWLQIYGSMQGVMAHAQEVTGKIGEYLRDALEQLPQSYDLATIRKELPLGYQITEIQAAQENKELLLTLFQEYEFKSWIKELSASGDEAHKKTIVGVNSAQFSDKKREKNTHNAQVEESATAKYQTIVDEKTFLNYFEQLIAAPYFAFDTETTSLDFLDAQLVGVSFSTQVGEGVYVPVGHDYIGAPQQLDRDWVLAKIKPLLEDNNKLKVGQNLKYDRNVLLKYAIQLRGIKFDTMLESYVLDATATRHDLDSLAKFYLQYTTIKFEDIAGKGKNQLSFNQIALEEAGPYAAEDADISLRLHELLWPQLQERKLDVVFTEIEMPLVSVLADVEAYGVNIDGDLLSAQSVDLEKKLQQIEKKAYELAGEKFNLSSPKQLAEVLFAEHKLNLPVVKKTATGIPSTAEDVLQELALDYPLPKVLLSYRSLAKLKSTYTDKLPQMIHPISKRVHTSYHQAVVATGRLSSVNPNLQNIPIKTQEGRRIRQAFVAPKNSVILAADYSQIELRIMAHLSKDMGLLTAFNNGKDIHSATAAEIFSVKLDAVTSEMRRSAKAINFGLIYGMSAFGLARQLNVGRHDAQEYMNLYFSRYPGVQIYMNNIRAQAREDGYVETLFGRRLYLSEIFASNQIRQQAAMRAAINAPMQGSAADIIKKAMIDVAAYIQTLDAPVRMIMQVHDELVFEVAEDILSVVQENIRRIMSSAADLLVPLIVDIGVGANWDEAH